MSSNDFSEAYAVEWHPDSEHLHLSPLSVSLGSNAEAYFRGVAPGWYIIGVGRTYIEAAKLMEQLENGRT